MTQHKKMMVHIFKLSYDKVNQVYEMMMLRIIIILLVKNSVALEDTFNDGLVAVNETIYDTYDEEVSFENETYSGSILDNVDHSDHVFALYLEDKESWQVSALSLKSNSSGLVLFYIIHNYYNLIYLSLDSAGCERLVKQF